MVIDFISTGSALQEKVAIVTGASSGIGKAVAKALAGSGVKVAMAARRVDQLREVESEITKDGGVCISVKTDVVARSQVCEPRHEKTDNEVFEQVWHKLSFTRTGDGYRLEILNLERRRIVLSVKRKQRC